MKFRIPALVLACMFCSCSLKAERVFDFNANCVRAYQEIIQLKLVAGQQWIDLDKKQHPENLIPYFLENYIDFFILFFNEDPAEYKKRIANLGERLELMNKGPENSPLYLFTKAIIHFQWAAVQIKFGRQWDAGWEFRRSFLQIRNNEARFPAFYPSQLYRGAMQVAAGTIPEGYRWLSNLLGIKGTIREGMEKLETYLGRTDPWSALFREEAIFYYCYLKFYIQNDKKGALAYIEQQKLDLRNNHLFAYLAANLSLNSQQSDKVIQIIQSRNPSADYLFTPVWDLELGYARINHLDPAGVQHLLSFLKNFKGKSYVKDVLQKISWFYFWLGDMTLAAKYRKDIFNNGGMETDADKQAMKEAKAGTWPNKLLLQARLLDDGGFFREALALLHGKKYTDFSRPEDQVEFNYRAGRIYQDLGIPNDAIEFYKLAIRLGKDRKEYFAARAALHIGNIFEEKGNCQEAQRWYQQCLDMEDHDYKNSLDQRAKAGIKRCKGE